MQNPSHHSTHTNQVTNTRKLIGGIHGYGEDDKLFVIMVYEGDEIGHYLTEGDAGFVKAVREVAATAHHAPLIERWLEQYDQQCKEKAQ